MINYVISKTFNDIHFLTNYIYDSPHVPFKERLTSMLMNEILKNNINCIYKVQIKKESLLVLAQPKEEEFIVFEVNETEYIVDSLSENFKLKSYIKSIVNKHYINNYPVIVKFINRL